MALSVVRLLYSSTTQILQRYKSCFTGGPPRQVGGEGGEGGGFF